MTKLTPYQKEILQIDIGTAYNDQKISNRYGSANGLMDKIIDIIESVVEFPSDQGICIECEKVKKLQICKECHDDCVRDL